MLLLSLSCYYFHFLQWGEYTFVTEEFGNPIMTGFAHHFHFHALIFTLILTLSRFTVGRVHICDGGVWKPDHDRIRSSLSLSISLSLSCSYFNFFQLINFTFTSFLLLF